MQASKLIDRSSGRMAVQGVLVLAALVLLAPQPAAAELIVRAQVGPVRVAVNTPGPARCGIVAGPGLVLRSVAARHRGPGECRCKVHKSGLNRPRHAVWIKGHFEQRRHQGKVWIPGHWVERGPQPLCGQGPFHR